MMLYKSLKLYQAKKIDFLELVERIGEQAASVGASLIDSGIDIETTMQFLM